ncbi:amino acid adenylation domain-containing protein [Clostridium beijerinckii]|uniref:non-ribosomal peptide synthetase n=1 Tax=Clostridium beijerinckii TaxID=1520 RepID=UPI00156E56AD|nr:amino acid adenylation domain-containing protein [Clostridium beijerinckii]
MGIGNKLDKTNIENIIDLTSLQQGMLFHYINDEKSTEYHEQLSLTITGIVKIELLQKAWDFVIENNEMLRTVFRWKGIDKPIQIILKNHKVLIQKIDMTNELNKDIAVENVKITELKSRIDITKETLRIYLCKLEDCKYEMIISNHHILYDGWSNGIILNELMEAYTNLYDGKELRINNKTKFSEFIKYINNLDAEKQKKYWTNYLQDLGNKDDGFASKSSGIYKEISYKINNIKSNKIKDFAKENRILLSSLLYGTWGVLVQKFTDSNEVMFGTTVSGRPESIKLIDSMVGLFVNTIPLRVKSEGNTTLINLIRNIERMLSERKDFENTSLVDIKGYCGLRADEELFNSIVTIENYPLDLNKDNVLEIENFSIVEKTNYNMALEILTFNGIEFKFNFNSGAIDESIVQKLGGYLERIIDSVIDSPNARISQVEILRKAELNEILNNFNNTKTEYPKDKTIYNLFEEQVNKTPDKVALEFKEEKVTYKELNEKSNQIANYLRENGIKNESIVGIMMSHSIELVIGILAVLKAGGTYLPIDPSYPADRVNYMLEDSQSSMLLVNIEVHEEIQYKGKIVNINKINIDLYIKENLMKINQLNNLAYIIYTSGSTGKPKGVMIEHQGLTNYIWWAKKMYLKDDNDVMALHSSISFDLTITSIFTPLIAGNKIVIYDSDDTEFVLYKILRENKTTVMKLTPAHLSLLKDMDNSNSNIKRFIVGGEDLKVSLAKEVCNSFKKNIEICNEYGPTETVVGCMIYKYNEEKDKGASVPIGYPADNVQIYILDNELNVVPTGFVGELYISGDGVARGYLNREELTRDRFIENPFIKGKRMYRTGDTARYLENGAIEYLGRSDNQVKIRGYRIEVGEIENRLLQHNDIKEAAVVVKENKEKYMCAYVVSKKNADELNLKSYLKETLPEYMIPSYIMQVNKMPLTANGKLDRRALPEPTLEGILNTYEAPRNELEEKLAKIWSELLGIEKVGINDNFFELGGHSLKAIVLMSKIHKELNKEITLKELFKLPTIRELSKLIEDEKESFYSRIEKIEEKDYYEVSSSQKRMYMLQQFEDNSIAYNMPVVFELEGEINRERIEETFKKLVKRHDALRTYFETFEDKIVQRLDNSYEFKLEDTKETEDIETSINKFIRAFKLDKAPLFRVELVENKGKSYLFIDMHHIISDGVSMSILVKEITELYNGEMLKPLRLQYKDFAAWQNNFLKSEEMKIQEEYWINTFSDEIPILNMPNDYERPVIQSFEGDSVSFEVDEKITESLRKLARETGSTMHMVLLSAFNILLSKYSGQEDIVIGTPIAGRTHADLQGIMGIFVNTLALRNKPEGNKKYLDFLKEVKENALNAYENQSYQFEELVEKLDIRRDTSKNPLFDVMFDLSDTVTEEDIKLDGVLLKQYKKKNIISKFDLTLNALEKEKTLEFNLEYCTKIFKKETVERISNHYIKVLDDITRNTKVKIFEIELLTEKEKEQIINEFNDTKADYPKDKTIQELFEEQVKKTPNYTAVVSNDGELTYKELNEKSNQLARILREKGIKQNQTVGVMVERSTEMIVSIMAVLKSGGAYLPIDPEYPLERIKYMLQDSQTQTILTQIHLVDKIEFAGSTIRVDDMSIYNGDSSNLSVVNTCNDMPYIIYTSGTTGKPKGVMIKHRGVVNIANWFNIRYCIEENRNILQMTSISFDVSALEIFTGLLYGGTLYIPQKETILDREKFIKYIKNNKINIAQFVPITLKELLAESDKVDSLRVIISGADRLEDSLKEQIIAKGYNLYNHYGPTETTIDAISSKCENGKVVIGKPIYNTQIYVLNENNQLQPIGVPGELCISSDGLAKGYLNSPDLTAMKFIPNPFLPDKKMYRTGDLVRWLPDGNIEYLCRIDHQVKVRGIRVELGEIERQLLQYEAVREVVVVGKKDEKNNTYLIAYMVSDKKLKVQEVRQYLLADLPSYMVPSYFMQIDSMPLTQNGKIDRKGLPEFSKTMDTSAEYEGPTNEIEHKLLDIWKEVLGNDDIGINDDFFELGGHSLKATVLASKIRKELSIEVALKEIFRSTTIKALAANISLMEKINM